jgi:hypothetical protein
VEYLIVLVALAVVAIASFVHYQKTKHHCRGHETGRRYMPGIMETGGKARGFVDERMIYGYTEITYKCDGCGRYFNNTVVGKING